MRRRRGEESPPQPPRGSAYVAALRLLGRRDYTAAEVTDRLRKHGYLADDITQAVERLVADRSIDDRRVAVAHMHVAHRIKARGKRRIRLELEARGVPASVVTTTLEELSVEDEAVAIRRVLDQRKVQGVLPPAEHRKVFQQLLRRGFSAEAIGAALRERSDR